ncbi:MAG: FtsW/RodA/SpoVE family cell cycle protein [Lachnospiraceae bacterium]|nr:FtsW/RodA/SpoVE family cell cycle protein [Lachnospiraceae bacterium]
MVRLLIIISRYILVLLSALFSFVSFKSLKDSNKNQYRYVILQRILMYLIHFIMFAIIYVYSEKTDIIFFYLGQVFYFVLFNIVANKVYKRYHKPLMNLMIFMLMVSFGIITRLSYTRAVRQFYICVFATVIAMSMPKIMEKSKKIRNYSYIFGVLGIGALALVYVIGNVTLGAKLSLDLHFITIQPSEFVKISFVLFLSGILYKSKTIKGVLISGIFAAIHVLILVVSKDLGTALILCVVYLFIVYMATGKKIYLIGGLFAGSAASLVAYKLFSHVKVRVEAWINPWPIIDDKGYQITQSLFAIGTGGLFGSGLFMGLPNSVPVVEQDFIISAICEELGSFFSICIVLMSMCIFIISIRIALNCKDEFYKLTTSALACTYGFQIFLTVGGAIKLIPSTGVTYPLLSYGGSSLLSTIAIFMILQGVYINETKHN